MSGGGKSSSQTIGYKYLLGMHLGFTGWVCDRITEWQFDNRSAWTGSLASGRATIIADDLYGGEKREGGVSGNFDFLPGDPEQAENDYLAAQLGALNVSAYRGITSVVFRQMYLGNNPYLKPMQARLQRIYKTGQHGEDQWYPETAGILSGHVLEGVPTVQVYEEFTDGLDDFTDESGNPFDATAYDISGGALRIRTTAGGNNRLIRPIPPHDYTHASVRFVVTSVGTGLGDAGRFDVVGLGSVFPYTETVSDVLHRMMINGILIGVAPITVGVWYRVDLDRISTTQVRHRVYENDNNLISEGVSIVAPATASSFGFSNLDPISFSGEMVTLYDYVRLRISDTVYGLDMNPAHMLREIIIEPSAGLGQPASEVDDASFTAAADMLFDEGFGLSVFWRPDQQPVGEFFDEINRHIDAALYIDRHTGKFTLKLIRDDYDAGDLLVLDESNVDRVEDYRLPDIGDLINSVAARYRDISTGRDSITANVQDLGLIAAQGGVVNHHVADYPMIRNATLAARVAARELASLSRPLARCVVYANRAAAHLNPGDVFKLTWPDVGANELILRVARIAYGSGRNRQVRIEAVQDQFSLPQPMAAVTPPPVWVNPVNPPAAPANQLLIEAPYLALVRQLGQTAVDADLATEPDRGYLIAAAPSPTPDAINAQVWTDAGAGYANVGTLDWCAVATLAADLDKTAETIAIADALDIDIVAAGTWAQIDDELVEVVAVTDSLLTLKRGVLDTVPAEHASGAVIYFWENYTGEDQTAYVAGESPDVKLLTVTGTGVLELIDAPTGKITLESRAIRPYPPGNLTFGGVPYAETIPGNDMLSVGWSHRDRLQQTGGLLIDTTETSIGPEAGTTYTIRIYDEHDNLLKTVADIAGETYVYSDEADPILPSETWRERIATFAPTASWRCDQTSGTALPDSSGNGHNGTINTDPTFGVAAAPGVGEGTAIETVFNSHYGQVPHSAALNPRSGEFAISFWLRWTNTNHYSTPFRKSNDTAPFDGVAVWINGTPISGEAGRIYLACSNDTGQQVLAPETDLNDGQWRHFICQRREISPGEWRLQIYINGILSAEATPASVLDLNTSGDLQIFGVGTISFGITGAHDEYDYFVGRSFSASEAAYIYGAPIGGQLNGSLRVEIESVRDGYTSLQHHDHTVRRTGFGFNFGYNFGE